VRELSGRPAVALHGRAQAIAENLGLMQWALSLSYSFPDFWLLLHVAVQRECVRQAAEHYVEAARVYRTTGR